MFINQDIVSVIFRLINFFAIIGLSLYLFKKNILPTVSFSIAQEIANHKFLYEQQTHLEKQQATLDAILKEETLLCQHIKSNIDEWKRIVTQEDELREKENNEKIAALHNRRTRRAEQIEHDSIQNHLIDTIIVDAEQSLTQHFLHDASKDQYINEILAFMNERVQ